MFPCTNFGPSGRVDNSDVILEIRINKGLQFCYQYYALNMARVDGIDICRQFLIVPVSRNMSIGFSVILEKLPFEETYQLYALKTYI